MKSTWIKLLAALFAVSLVAAACGSDSVDEIADVADSGDSEALTDAQEALAAAQNAASAAEADAETAQAEAAAAVAAAESGGDVEVREFEGQVIRITGPERSPEEWGAIETAMEPFEELTGAQVIFTGSADWEGEINVQIAAGNPPEISFFPQPGKLADFARDGLVVELPSDVLESVDANWNDSAMDFGNVDGVQFGVPAKNDLKSIVWHKPAVFEAGGYAIPETWDELKELTNTMIADGITPWCVGIESGQATGWTFTDWTEDLVLRFIGVEGYDEWVAGDLEFSDPRVIEVFDEILALWNTPGAVFAGGGSIASSHHSSDPAEGLAADNCAMVRQATFFSGFLPEGSAADIDTFYFPSIDDNKPVLGAGILAGAFVDSPAVWSLMDYVGSPEYANARQIAQRDLKGGEGVISGFLSANVNADQSLWTPLEQGFLGFMQDAAVFRFDGSDLMPADVGAGTFWTQATAMVNGEITPTAAAAAIDASWPEDS